MMASLGYLLDTLQPIADAVAEKWQEEMQRSSTASGGGAAAEHKPNSSSDGGSSNPFISRSTSDDRRGLGQGSGYHNSVTNGDHVSLSWGGAWGLGSGQNHQPGVKSPTGYSNGNLQQQAWQQQQHGDDLFGSMLEAAAQALRGGVAAVNKWLAVRVVWWEQRAGWCELLYRWVVTLRVLSTALAIGVSLTLPLLLSNLSHMCSILRHLVTQSVSLA